LVVAARFEPTISTSITPVLDHSGRLNAAYSAGNLAVQ
jgi:hypothetical protein